LIKIKKHVIFAVHNKLIVFTNFFQILKALFAEALSLISVNKNAGSLTTGILF